MSASILRSYVRRSVANPPDDVEPPQAASVSEQRAQAHNADANSMPGPQSTRRALKYTDPVPEVQATPARASANGDRSDTAANGDRIATRATNGRSDTTASSAGVEPQASRLRRGAPATETKAAPATVTTTASPSESTAARIAAITARGKRAAASGATVTATPPSPASPSTRVRALSARDRRGPQQVAGAPSLEVSPVPLRNTARTVRQASVAVPSVRSSQPTLGDAVQPALLRCVSPQGTVNSQDSRVLQGDYPYEAKAYCRRILQNREHGETLQLLPKTFALDQLVLIENAERDQYVHQERMLRTHLNHTREEERLRLEEFDLFESHKLKIETLREKQVAVFTKVQDDYLAVWDQMEAELEEHLALASTLQPRSVIKSRVMREIRDGDPDVFPMLMAETKRVSATLKRIGSADREVSLFRELLAASFNFDAIVKGVPFRASVEDCGVATVKAADRKVVVIKPFPQAQCESSVAAYVLVKCAPTAEAVLEASGAFPLTPYPWPGAECLGIIWTRDALSQLRVKQRAYVQAKSGCLSPAEVLQRSAASFAFAGASSCEVAAHHDIADRAALVC